MNAEQLVEDKSLREKYAGRVEVLDKVKVLSLLPDGEHLTLSQVADYFQVDVETIRKITQRHRDELESDGLESLQGEKYKYFAKDTLSRAKIDVSPKVRKMIIFTRRAILRTGMLLRDSEVAKQVRNYLLNVEENTPKETKQKSFENFRTEQENLIILNCVLESIHNDGTLQQGLEKASRLINKKFSTTNSRWHNKIKKIVSNDVLVAIKNNQGKNKSKTNNIIEFNNNQDVDYIETLNNKFDDIIRENIRINNENKELIIKDKELEIEISKWKNKYKSLKKEYDLLMNVIGKAVKNHTREELRFKVDQNGIVHMD